MQIGIKIDNDGKKWVVVSILDNRSQESLMNLMSPDLARLYAELLLKSADAIDKSEGE